MHTKIQRWGNSLGVRIPKTVAEDALVEAGSTVDLSVQAGELIIRPVRTHSYELDSLLNGITPQNVHEGVETGPPVGLEAW